MNNYLNLKVQIHTNLVLSKERNITVVGSGYVGMSLSVLFAQKHNVVVLDIDPKKVDQINNGESTILDSDIDKFL